MVSIKNKEVSVGMNEPHLYLISHYKMCQDHLRNESAILRETRCYVVFCYKHQKYLKPFSVDI